MGTVISFTKERLLALEAATIVGGSIVGDILKLTKHDGTTVDAGNVRGHGFWPVTADIANISAVAGSLIGDYFVNSDIVNHTILGVANVLPGGVVRATSATNGVASGTIRGPMRPIPLVSALPGAPADGDEIYFQNSTMAAVGARWHLAYRAGSASAYKWEYVGGSYMYKAGTKQSWNDRSAANNTANGYLDPTAPQITVPLAGDYELDGTAVCVTNNGTAAPGIVIGTSLPGGGWPDSDSLANGQIAGGGVHPLASIKQLLGLSASTVISMYFMNANTGGSVSFYKANMRLRPLRVG